MGGTGKVLLIVFVLVTLLTLGCTNQQIVCNKPYILVGVGCCLDQNNNLICDKDEEQPKSAVVEQPEPVSNTSAEKGVSENEKTTFISQPVVAEVFDGDTFTLSTGEKIRLLGINAPEEGQPYSEEATAMLMNLVFNKEVELVSDLVDKDQYERLLRHVFVNSTHVNKVMIENGLATTYFISPNYEYRSELLEAEENAKKAGINLWKKAEPTGARTDDVPSSKGGCSQCVAVSQLHFNAEGNDCYNLNDEYAVFRNECSYECDLTSWMVKDEANHLYTFSSFVLAPNSQVTLYTGNGQDSTSQLYWKSSGYPCNAIWNNDGDTLFLRDSQGSLITTYPYTGYK